MNNYYDQNYFTWQKKAGKYGASQDIRYYMPFLKKSDTVLDFGCGGGYLLSALPVKMRYGADINPEALKIARENGITTFLGLQKIPKSLKVNVIISHHTLEHVENPAEILRALRQHLKPGGKLVVIVPIDDWRNQKKYTRQDINKHLYTWTPLLLGNLFITCGYALKQVDIITAAWLPLSRFYYAFTPHFIYAPVSYLWSMLIRSRQIRIVVTPGK
jgi:SAM-dependent methyltransferase